MLPRLLLLIVLMLNSLCAISADFRKVSAAITAYRQDPKAELTVVVKSDSFVVTKRAMNQIAADEGDSASRRMVSATLKIDDTGNWIEYRVDDNTSIRRPIGELGQTDPSRSWKKVSAAQIDTFPSSEWHNFIAFGISRGLSGIVSYQENGYRIFILQFAPPPLSKIATGKQNLIVPRDFNVVMRKSPRYPEYYGDGGFVILVHDPHQDVAGRYETMKGLDLLLSSNVKVDYHFLVEGAYDSSSRDVSLGGLDRKLPRDDVATTGIVYSMLRNYVINVPIAFQLLHKREHVYAIDDNNHIDAAAPRVPRTLRQRIATLRSLQMAVLNPGVPQNVQPQAQELGKQLFLCEMFATADISDAGHSYVKYFDSLSKLSQLSLGAASALRDQGVDIKQADLNDLSFDAKSFADQARVYGDAVTRSVTMSAEIIKNVRESSKLQIAFIGSFHTRDIIAKLKESNVGYIVIEPRPRLRPSMEETQRFYAANYGKSRAQYLSSVRLYLGAVAPSREEVDTKLAPQFAPLAVQVREARDALSSRFNTVGGSGVNIRMLEDALDFNGSIQSAKVASGAGSPPPPGIFSRAFAYFEPPNDGSGSNQGSFGGGATIVLVNPKDARWTSSDRYSFLALALFKEPPRDVGTPGDWITFYPDSKSKRLYTTYYDPQSRRIYCFEGAPNVAAKLVAVPVGDEKTSENIRSQVTHIFVVGARENG